MCGEQCRDGRDRTRDEIPSAGTRQGIREKGARIARDAVAQCLEGEPRRPKDETPHRRFSRVFGRYRPRWDIPSEDINSDQFRPIGAEARQ